MTDAHVWAITLFVSRYTDQNYMITQFHKISKTVCSHVNIYYLSALHCRIEETA